MMGKTHMAFGLFTGLFAFSYFNQKWYLFLPLVVIGSLLPDIDHEGSKINKMLPLTRHLAKFFKHRGFFHSIFPILIIYFTFKYFNLNWIGIPLAIGYTAHLGSDCITKMGINLAHPISTIRIQGFMETGGTAEALTMILVIIGILTKTYFLVF